jgi:hypothetical protein
MPIGILTGGDCPLDHALLQAARGIGVHLGG